MIQLPNPLDEVLDIPDDVFINSEGVPSPRTKRRRNIMDFEQQMLKEAFRSHEKAFKAENATYNVHKALI